VVVVLFVAPAFSLAVPISPCVSVSAGTDPVLTCSLNDLEISGGGSGSGGGGGGGPAITFLTTPLLDPGVQFGTASSPILFSFGSSTSSIFFDVATQDGTARIEDFSFSASGLNLTNGGTGTATATLTSGGTTLGSIVLSSGTTSGSFSFTPISSGHFVFTLAGSCPSLTGCGSVDSFTARFSELAATVPEPSTLLLVGVGVGAVGAWRRRRNAYQEEIPGKGRELMRVAFRTGRWLFLFLFEPSEVYAPLRKIESMTKDLPSAF